MSLSDRIEYYFGEQPFEKVLRKSDNVNVKSLLGTIAFFRFILFPFYASLWVVGALINMIIFLLETGNDMLEAIYRLMVDGTWLSLSWFNLNAEELLNECKKAYGEAK